MCDSLVARGARTVDGATLFAKNSDRRGRECQPFVQHAAAFHPRGSRVRCTHVEIDQVGETYRVMGHSPDWCWGFEHGVNEFGVAIGNHATWSREPLETEPGLIGMDLVRLGLERGRDAREALEVIATLIETHGQGGSAFAAEGDGGYQNSFAIADGRSAWVLETTARGWAARSVEGAALTNALTLGGDWQIGSRDLERHACEQGYWSSEQRLDFKAAYGRDGEFDVLTRRRREASARCLAGGKLSVDGLKRWLCDHGRSALPPAASLEPGDPERYSICMHADPLSTTTASLVARLPRSPRARPWPVWISFATPCTGIFLPVYLDGIVPASLASSESETPRTVEAGSAPRRSDTAATSARSVGSMWESMRRVQERAEADFERAHPILRDAWGRVTDAIESDRRRVESEIGSLEDSTREVAEKRLTDLMHRTAERVLEAAARLAETL